MNYFALFLDGDSYVEKCLTLIRFICNPESRSLPHITISLYNKLNKKLEYTRYKVINQIDLIGTGKFTNENNLYPYVVYIECKSDELEEIKYKPDFPYSKLHITIYEGNDIDYADGIYRLLERVKWHFVLNFDKPRKLYEKAIGSKINDDSFKNRIDLLLKEMLNIHIKDFFKRRSDNKYRLELVGRVLDNLNEYLITNHCNFKYYDNNRENITPEVLIDASAHNIINKSYQMSFTLGDSIQSPYVKKRIKNVHYVTPPEYAREMAICALEAFGNDLKEIDFGDPAIGTGGLFLALKHLIDDENQTSKSQYILNSAIGVDIDEAMAKEALSRCGRYGLKVIYGDVLSPTIEIGNLRNMIIVNPPYDRHEYIPEDYKLRLRELAEKQTGISINRDAGLYVYYLLIMDKWLSEKGVAVWLLPSIFLQTKYGIAIRKYLLNNVQLIKLHVYDDKEIQFDNVNISTTIVVFRKMISTENYDISVSHGSTAVKAPSNNIKIINKKELQESSKNWRKVIFSKENEAIISSFSNNNITFEELFDIKRGIATGANSFFAIDLRKAEKYGIPDVALKPLLPKAKFLKSSVINVKENGFPDVEPQLVLIDCDFDEDYIKTNYPEFFSYLQGARMRDKSGRTIIERALVSARNPWYKQEKREPAPFLFTYMGRHKKSKPPLNFILNKSKAVALNTYLLLYPKGWLREILIANDDLFYEILLSLNKTAELIALQTRVYSGGLHKLEPGEFKKFPFNINILPHQVIQAYKIFRHN